MIRLCNVLDEFSQYKIRNRSIRLNIYLVNSGEFNASWNTEAKTHMCHIILCFEVIFVIHIPAV